MTWQVPQKKHLLKGPILKGFLHSSQPPRIRFLAGIGLFLVLLAIVFVS